MDKGRIEHLVRERKSLLKKSDYSRQHIDNLTNQIYQSLYEQRDTLSVEYILETISRLGGAPSILCDDFGHFAMTDEAMQSLPRNPNKADDIEFSALVEKKYWKNSVREAISCYLEELVSEER